MVESDNKKDETERHMHANSPTKIPRNLESEIIDLYLSGDITNIRKADELCSKNFIDRGQFLKYHNPDSGERDDIQTIKIIPSIAQNYDEPIITVPGITGTLVPFYDSFPYTIDDLLKIKTLKPEDANIFHKLAEGLMNTYNSKLIMRVFNKKEFLAKLVGISELKNEKTHLGRLKTKLDVEEDVENIFDNIISFLDNMAYIRGEWHIKTSGLKDVYSKARNQQKMRIQYIPIGEKEKYVDTILNKPYIPLITNSDQKKLYADFIINKMKNDWNNT